MSLLDPAARERVIKDMILPSITRQLEASKHVLNLSLYADGGKPMGPLERAYYARKEAERKMAAIRSAYEKFVGTIENITLDGDEGVYLHYSDGRTVHLDARDYDWDY